MNKKKSPQKLHLKNKYSNRVLSGGSPKKLKKCAPGKVRSPTTNRCIKSKGSKPVKKLKECAPGKVRSPTTNRCVKPKGSKAKSPKAKRPSLKKLAVYKRPSKDLCIKQLSLCVGDYDNYGFNGKYNKCLEFKKTGWKEVNPKLGFRSEYVTDEQIQKAHAKFANETENQLRLPESDRSKNWEWWANNPEGYVMNTSSLESEELCHAAGNWKFPGVRVGRSNNKLLTDDLSKKSCVYCKQNEPNKVIYRKTNKKWYIQDLLKSTECERTGINSPNFYKPREAGKPEDVIFETYLNHHLNPPEESYGNSGFITVNGNCLKEPSWQRGRLNEIWDDYDAGKLTKREHRDQINEQWEMWNNETYDREGWELKHLK